MFEREGRSENPRSLLMSLRSSTFGHRIRTKDATTRTHRFGLSVSCDASFLDMCSILGSIHHFTGRGGRGANRVIPGLRVFHTPAQRFVGNSEGSSTFFGTL